MWHANPPHAVTAGPAVAPSGTIFAGADTIYGVAADGQLRWKDPSLKPGDAGLLVLGNDGVFDAATGDMGAVLTGDGSYVWTVAQLRQDRDGGIVGVGNALRRNLDRPHLRRQITLDSPRPTLDRMH